MSATPYHNLVPFLINLKLQHRNIFLGCFIIYIFLPYHRNESRYYFRYFIFWVSSFLDLSLMMCSYFFMFFLFCSASILVVTYEFNASSLLFWRFGFRLFQRCVFVFSGSYRYCSLS